MTTPNSRKRPVPGNNPNIPLQMRNSPGVDDQMIQWSGQEADIPYNLGVLRALQQYPQAIGDGNAPNHDINNARDDNANVNANTSGSALARRPTGNSRALIPTSPWHPSFDPGTGAWPDSMTAGNALALQQPFGAEPGAWPGLGIDDNALTLQVATDAGTPDHDSIEKMEEAALRAKRAAQAKRKQIPPFVQKLSR